MQHALLGLAIALIAAIAAALAAPAYIDWNDWRGALEARATAFAGVPVRIRGRIEASILPTPAFVLRGVEVGEPDRGTGLRAGEARGILSLGALLRGAVEAEEFVLVRPTMRIAVEGGQPLQSAAGAAAAATGVVSFARVVIEGGTLAIEDRARGVSIVADEISAQGELNGRQGPTRIDANFRHEGRRWRLRANAGQFGADGAGRVRATLDNPGDGIMFDAEGKLSLAGAAPQFEGKSTLARRGAQLPWQIVANARASETSVALDGFELSLGADAAPIEIAGNVQLAPRRGGRIDGTLSARRLDLDAPAGVDAPKSLASALGSLREVSALLAGLPLNGRIAVAVEAMVAGGGTVRDLNGEFSLREGTVGLQRLEARLPGRGTIKASGAGSAGTNFTGEASLEAEDAAALAQWAFGFMALPPEQNGPMQARGNVDWSGGRLAIDRISLAYGEARLGGRAAIAPGEGNRRTAIEADLSASGIDLDLLAPLVEAIRSGAGADLSLVARGNALRLLDRSVRRIEVALSRNGDAIAFERLAVEDFDGLSLRASGRVASLADRPSGRIDFELDAARGDALAELARRFGGADSGALVQRLLRGPLRLKGAVSGAGLAAGIEVGASGKLADVDVKLAASFDLLAESLAEAQLGLETNDAGRLIALFGLTPGPPAPGDASLEIDFSRSTAGTMPLAARLTVPGGSLAAEGELRHGAEGRIVPRLNLRLDAADIRPLLAAAARSNEQAAVPAEGSARLIRTSEAFAFENVALTLGGARVRGGVTFSGTDKPAIGGKLSIERMELAHVLALVLGNAPEGGAFWPIRLNPAALAAATGALQFDVGALGLADRLTATDAKFRLKLGAGDAAIEELSADLAGGKMQGHARFVRGDRLGLDGTLKVSSFEIARVLAPGTWRAPARGRGDLTLTLAGSGPTPAALVASLTGQGTLLLQGLEIDRLDPNAIAAVFAAAEAGNPLDEVGVVAALAPAFAKGPLQVARVEAPLVVASGVMRTGKISANAGAAQLSATANFDIGRLTVDGAIEIEASAPPGLTARPGAIVRWRGPLASPERAIEAAALATAITLRAMERETKRIEERDRALPPRRSDAPATGANPVAAVAPPEEPAISAPPAAISVPLPPSRPRANTQSAPTLPPPTNVRPAPSIFSPQ